MDHLQQLLRQNEAELAHALQWENEFQSEVQREKDILTAKNELHLALDKHSRRLHDADNQSEQLERDIKLLFETNRNSVLQARPSVEESVVVAKEQLDNHHHHEAGTAGINWRNRKGVKAGRRATTAGLHFCFYYYNVMYLSFVIV